VLGEIFERILDQFFEFFTPSECIVWKKHEVAWFGITIFCHQPHSSPMKSKIPFSRKEAKNLAKAQPLSTFRDRKRNKNHSILAREEAPTT